MSDDRRGWSTGDMVMAAAGGAAVTAWVLLSAKRVWTIQFIASRMAKDAGEAVGDATKDAMQDAISQAMTGSGQARKTVSQTVGW